jgi:hypothetical protein
MGPVRDRLAWLGLATLLGGSLAPRAAAADRGALTFEVGPALALVRTAPSVGSAPSLAGTMGGGRVGVRYGLRNNLELTASAHWDAPARFYHSDARVAAAGQSLQGTLAETAQRFGAMAGMSLVGGYVWRYHLGLEVGWTRQRFTRRDLVDVSDPNAPTSYGLGLANVERNAFVVAPRAGLEWQITDHWSVSAIPRLEILFGAVGRVAFVVPVCVGYSWYAMSVLPSSTR